MDPTSIGRYQVVRRLGRGGMGTLFLARDPAIDRLVAIKMLREDVDNEDLVERFSREARLAGRLRHPNIVTIFDVGTQAGRPFIAMEYILGETLQAVIAERRTVRVARRLEWIEQLCAGLHYAHRSGVIHRDIKPANLMIDAEGQLKILDFGIARLDESEMTRTGTVVGTLHYMAPEQFEGRIVDARADVFSVGAVAYELLSYQRAFRGGTAAAVMHNMLSGAFEPLDTVCPSLDPDLVTIVTRCLETDLPTRWSDLDVVRQQLAGVRHRLAEAEEHAQTTVRPTTSVPVTPSPGRAASELDEQIRDAPERQSRGRRRGHGRTLSWTIAAAVVLAIAGVVMVEQRGRVLETGTPVTPHVEPAANELGAASATGGGSAAVSVGARDGASATTPAAPDKPLRSKVEPVSSQPGTSGSRTVSDPAVATASSSQAAQTGCDRGDGGMCFELGISYRTGRGAVVDHTRATGLFQRACDDGFARGCNAVGVAYARGLGVLRDDARAAALYQRGCDNGDGNACVNLGRMHESAASMPKDDSRATALFVRGCDAGDNVGCSDAGRMYELGQGVAKDEARAVTLYQRACANGHAPACASFGWMYFRGAGVEKDEARGVMLFQQACDAGNPAGCNNLGLASFQGRGTAKDVKRAAEAYQRGCVNGGPIPCTNLGLMYLRGQDVLRDDARAVMLFRQACDMSHPAGCFNLGFAYAVGRGVTKDESRAAVLYQRACDGGIGDACTRAASMYEQGAGVASDRARAATLYQRGRDLVGGRSSPPPPPGETRPNGDSPRDATAGNGLQPLRVGGAIKAPAKLKDARPTYPIAAKYAGVQGVVTIEVTIGSGGNVERTKVLQSIPLLDGAAEDAVKQWQYAPTLIDGRAVSVMMTVNVNFSLQDGAPK